MTIPGNPKIQHYVPQFLLRQFASTGKEQICAYDKWSGRVFRTHVRNVAAETGFYDLSLDEAELTLEPALTKLEDAAAKVVKKILDSHSITTVGEPDRAVLSMFLAVQLVRTKEHRVKFEDLTKQLQKKLGDLGFSRSQIDKTIPQEPEAFKWLGVSSVIRSREWLPYFLNKTWVLFAAPKTHPLYISDNPITLHNEREYGPYGNLGLAVEGIEIYVPISTSYCLGLLCPSIGEALKETYYNIELSSCTGMPVPPGLNSHISTLRPLWEGILFGIAVPLEPDNVTMLNSLQVKYSSRFVYCCRDEFSLVNQMIREKPKFKHGIRFTVD